MSKHRAERPSVVRARYGRIAAATLSLIVTAIALLGGVGLIPVNAGTPTSTRNTAADLSQGADTASRTGGTAAKPQASSPTPSTTAVEKSVRSVAPDPAALPAGTGSGKRVVFSESAQRVWLVGTGNRVLSTYLVSGSVTDNLRPGRYDVYSKSRWAVGIDDSGVMQYFVRFAHGPNAAIGFHSIPTKNGDPLQTVAQLGTPQSHGCIRQRLSDAQRLWDFAAVGTDVVVV